MTRKQFADDAHAFAMTFVAGFVLILGGGAIKARDFVMKQIQREMLPK